MSQYSEEIERRRTFAIISHRMPVRRPTENCCSWGAIHVAGGRKV